MSLTNEEKIKFLNQMDGDVEEDPEFISYANDVLEIVSGGEKHTGRPLGFEALDKLTGGVSSGELVIVTAPTGVGKTTFCQSVSWMLAQKGHPSLWYTLEVSLYQFLQPLLKNDAEAKWDDAGKLVKTSPWPIYFPKNVERINFKKLKEAINMAHVEYGVEHVFIDHLHYLLDHKAIERSRSTSLHIGDRLRELRQIALATGVSIFLVAHLTKTEDGKRPTLSDMRDSSFIGQEADVVICLWRDRLKEPLKREIDGVEFEETFSPITNCAIEKSRRTGQKGQVALKWNKGLYREMTQTEKEVIRMEIDEAVGNQKNKKGG